MRDYIRYYGAAAESHINAVDFEKIRSATLAARNEVIADLGLLHAGCDVPPQKQPLDAGFIELPKHLLAELEHSGKDSLVGRIESAAAQFADQVDRMVVLGIGGSYMGTRALFEALCHPYHNELSRETRNGIPRLSFEGNNVDSDAVSGLLDLLSAGTDPSNLADRWGIVVISKSGGTLETAVAFRVFREALEKFYGSDAPESTKLVIPITGETGKLRSLSAMRGYPVTFPIPDGVGGRFSVFTAVGLFPAAVLGIDVKQLLRGAAHATERFQTADYDDNPAVQYTAVSHYLERERGRTIRVLSTWGKRLEAVGLWYDQLLAESLGKAEQGATPITGVNTRDLHSRGQQHQEGTLDKLITNLYIEPNVEGAVTVPVVPDSLNEDDLNRYSGKNLQEILQAALQGTNQAYADVNRPTADLVLPKLDAYNIGALLQILMLATVTEGRLMGVNPYGQPGVEDYKRNMNAILSRS